MPGKCRRPRRSRGYMGCRRSRRQRRWRSCSEDSHAKVLDDGKAKLISEGEGGAVVPGGEEGARGAGGAGGAGDKENEEGAVKTAILKFSSLYPLYSCGAAAEGYKYRCGIVQILKPNRHNFDKTGHFHVHFGGNGLLEKWRTSVTESRPIPLCRPWIQRVYFIETWCPEALWRPWEEIE